MFKKFKRNNEKYFRKLRLCFLCISGKRSDIVLLENHGLICSGNNFKKVLDNSLKINKLCKDWLVRNTKTFTNYSTKFKTNNYDSFLFPDAVVLTEENSSINDYIFHTQKLHYFIFI